MRGDRKGAPQAHAQTLLEVGLSFGGDEESTARLKQGDTFAGDVARQEELTDGRLCCKLRVTYELRPILDKQVARHDSDPATTGLDLEDGVRGFEHALRVALPLVGEEVPVERQLEGLGWLARVGVESSPRGDEPNLLARVKADQLFWRRRLWRVFVLERLRRRVQNTMELLLIARELEPNFLKTLGQAASYRVWGRVYGVS